MSHNDCASIAIGIAGKIVHEMGVTDDWDGVVDLLREEFSDTGQDRSMEERIIRTSLNAIAGAHRTQILRLFNAFAIAPEDTWIPIEIVAALFEAESETTLAKSPSLLNIRRWLKVLIDRSLLLGTVDRPSLHGRPPIDLQRPQGLTHACARSQPRTKLPSATRPVF